MIGHLNVECIAVLTVWSLKCFSELKGLKDLMTQTDDHAVPFVYSCGYILFIPLLSDIVRLMEQKSDHHQFSL